ncbi:MAG: SH3 domain-containing protein [Anaerolineae bacterium]
MKTILLRLSVMLGVMLLCVSVVTAQSDCPTIVRTALDVAGSVCGGIGRNQACYGNITLNAVPQAGVSNFTFNQTGDVVSVADVQSLTLTSLDTTTDQWGVALMKIQANIPDTLPGQNVTLLLFGDVQMENAATPPVTESSSASSPSATEVTFTVTAIQPMDVLAEPSTGAAAVAKLPLYQPAVADGRDENRIWLHLRLVDGSAGWVSANDVSLLGDSGILPVLDSSAPSGTAPAPTAEAPQALSFSPMQAFLFKSGVDDRPCAEAPDSGILVQSPQGAASINLNVDGVDITLGSTAYLQAQPGGDLFIYVVEGHGTASAFNRTVTIPAGTWVRIPIGADLRATAAPTDPEGYDPRKFRGLPFRILPDEIEPLLPLPDDDIRVLSSPPAGLWTLTYDSDYIDVGCAADAYNGGFTTELRYAADGSIEWYSNVLAPVGFGVYEGDHGPNRIFKMVVVSPTQIEGQNIWIVPGCATIINNFHLVLDRAF